MKFVKLGDLPIGATFYDGHEVGSVDRHGRGMVHTANLEGGGDRALSPTRLVIIHTEGPATT